MFKGDLGGNMKKILQIGMTSNYGGIESFIMNLYRNINRDKYQFDFINMEPNNNNIAYSNEIESLGGNIYNIPGRRENLLENRKQLKNILSNNDYDFVHNNILTWSYSDGITLPLKYSSSKVIVHSHNSYMNPKMYARRFLNCVNRRLNHRDDLIRLACSDAAGKWLFRKQFYKVIPNGIETKDYKFNPTIRDEYRKKFDVKDKNVFLHVGRLSYQKNHVYLFKWFKEIVKQDPNSILFLVGEGEIEDKLKRLAQELKLSSKIKFLGIRNDVKNLMFMSDTFLFPSHYEGLGIVLIEAQASGLQCIASNRIEPEAKVTDQIKTIDITKSPNEYVSLALESITKSRESNREESYLKVKENGYDISETVKMLEEIYSS